MDFLRPRIKSPIAFLLEYVWVFCDVEVPVILNVDGIPTVKRPIIREYPVDRAALDLDKLSAKQLL
jgi:hypothetical protein